MLKRSASRDVLTRQAFPGKPDKVAYLYLAPLFLVYSLFLLLPLLRLVWFGLYEWNGLSSANWIGLANFRDLIVEESQREPFLHAGILIFFFSVIPVTVGLVLAAIVSRSPLRALGFFRTVLFMPQVVAMVVVAAAWRSIYAPAGTINEFLRAVGLDTLTRPWLGDYNFALPAIGIIGTWVGTGLTFILFLGGIAKIPRELYEAARIDGAGPIREFFSVTLPSLRYELSVVLTLTVIAAMRTFDVIYVTTRGGPGTSTVVPSFQVYREAFELGHVGSAAALAVGLTTLIFVLSFVITQIAERGRET